MDTVKVILNDGTEHVYKKNTSFYEISKDCHDVKNIMGVRINNEVFSLDKKITEDATLSFFGINDLIGNRMYKSALKFIFEVALNDLYPDLEIHYEHSVPRGMLGEIVGEKTLTHEEIGTIKEQMAKIIDEDLRFEKLNVTAHDAIIYYHKNKQHEKASNIQYINDRVVRLYKLKNKLNYFYSELPYSTKSISKFNIEYLGNNRLVFLFPTIEGGEVPEYVHYDNIIKSFLNSKDWLNKLKIPYVSNLNKLISDGKIKEFIRSNELAFDLEISKVAKRIINNNNIKFVMIAGPSGSGKTTTTGKLAAYLMACGYDPIKISLDDYFVNKVDTPKDENGDYDFECLMAIDIDRFNSDLNKLLNGGTIKMPRYNFVTGLREETKKEIKLNDNSIILIEGLHALNDELTSGIEAKRKFKIYLSPFIAINLDRHNYISTLDLRLLRRLIRDYLTRGYSVSDTIESWQSVRRGEENYIFPFIHQADVIINTALSYEIGVLKVYVEPLLYSVTVNSKYYEEARRLLFSLKQYFPIPGEYIPKDTILREFIGGGFND